jgi:APA family basic amino acid/polyamine antiporter
MAETATTEMKPTLGLTGLTSNAMALIAPGAFLWLTFYIQATEGTTAPAMWMGVLGALVLCLSTAVCYAEMAKLYPGTGSSYYFAEQAFLNRDKAWKFARISKFIVGWASHLYYWIYPGVMVGTMGIVCGYLVGTLYPNFMSASNPGMFFMMAVAVVFAFAVAYIAYRGVNSSTTINLVINVVQITALLIFAVFAIKYRVDHKPGSIAWQFDSSSGEAYQYEFKTTTAVVAGVSTDTIVRDTSGVPLPKLDASGNPVPFHVSYDAYDATGKFLAHPDAKSVIAPHHISWMFIQATVAILILVGFESVTAMGGEAKNAKRDVPIAVITSLLVQGVVLLRVLRRKLLPQQRVLHAERLRLRRSHRRHDDHRRRRALRLRPWPHLHAL